MSANDFPCVVWTVTEARFLPADAALPTADPVFAALVFAFVGALCAVADIDGRGWCIPGGRLEPGETPEAAIRREANEEAGLSLGSLHLIGHYQLLTPGDSQGRLVAVYISTIRSQDPLPAGTESRGVRLVTQQQLPSLYYLWDPLIEAVCQYAFALSSTHL